MPAEGSSSGSAVVRARVSAGDAAAAGLIACFLVLAVRGVWGQDATTDERHYFGVGREILRTHEWAGRGALLHPPLGYYVQSLPLLWLAGSSADEPFALLLCRITSLVVFGVPLLVVVFRWARELYGPAAGLLALGLAAFSPTLLAHAPLITPDVPLAATGTLALYLFRRSGYGAGRVLPWGVALGLALLTKTSAWLFVLVVALAGAAGVWRYREKRRWGRLAAGLLLAVLTVNIGYGFKGLLDRRGKAELVTRVPDVPLARVAALAASPFFPLPYLTASAAQLSVARRGVPSYLLGEVSTKGWWYYFLVALAVKETVPCLMLLAAGLVSLWWWRPRMEELFLLLPPVLFFGAFSLGHVQIGIRYVLPAFPFLFILTSRLARAAEGWKRPGRAAVALLLAAHAASAVRACPDFIAYFNELAGGPENGYRWLADSNLDWGQNRTRMEAAARKRGIRVEPDLLPTAGLVAVRVNRLVGIGDPETYRLLREEYDPVGNVGYNWLVYDLGRKRHAPTERRR